MAKKVINGKEYDLHGTDWMAEINRANSTGDYKLAAQYEQARNEKINSPDYTGKQATTSNYAGWLDTTDYGTIGKNQMTSGASWQDVLGTYNDRLNKSSSTIGMEKFVNDEIQKEMMDYIYAGMEKEAAAKPTYSFDTSRPTYTSQNQTRIDDMLNQILNREDFSYNAESDPLYQQYAAMYQREGNRAMNDTLAAAASDAGGMNSYAVTAAQQANNYYASQLGDKIPELYQLAYEMYLQDIDNQVRDLGLLQQMDDTQYGRYRDTMSDWENDRNFAYNQYRDDMGDYQWGQSFDHQVSQDKIDNEFRQDQFDWQVSTDDRDHKYQVGRDQVEDGRYDNETAYDRAIQMLSAGVLPDGAMLKAAGLSVDKAGEILASVIMEGGASPTQSTVDHPKATMPEDDDYEGGGYSNGGLTEQQIMELQEYYGVTPDGKWGQQSKAAANGWDASKAWDSYQLALKQDDIQGKPFIEYDAAASNYADMVELLKDMEARGSSKSELLGAIKEAYQTGALNLNDYSRLYNKYRG